MSRTERLLCAYCLVGSLVLGHGLTCPGAPPPPPGVVIGDFENGSFDGWQTYSDGASLGHTSTGATLGNSAMLMNTTPASFYFPAHRADTSLFPALLDATSLTMDVTYDRSQFAGSHDPNQSYAFMGLAIATPAGFFMGSPSYDNHTPPAFSPGFWVDTDTTTYPNNVDTRTVTFDFTQDINVPLAGFDAQWLSAMDAIRAGTQEYLDFFLVFDAGPGFTSPSLIVDNIRLNTVPEPGTFGLALLGFSAVFPLTRNRRS